MTKNQREALADYLLGKITLRKAAKLMRVKDQQKVYTRATQCFRELVVKGDIDIKKLLK